MRYVTATMLGLVFAAGIFAREDREAARRKELDDSRRELASLENIRAEKLEALEKKEAERWDARYRQAAKTKDNDEKARSLEEKYGRLTGDLGRLEEELVKARTEAKDKSDEADAARASLDGFAASVKRAADGMAENLSSDVPVALEERTLRVSRAGEALSPKSGSVDHAALREGLEQLLGVSLLRLDLTARQAVERRQAIFGEGRPAQAWRLQLGTVFVGELEKGDKGEAQILLRTGNLQGRTFVWRGDLAGDNDKVLADAVRNAAEGKARVAIPLDVLQYKSIGSGFVKGEQKSLMASFTQWFKAGGVTLYPLFAVGIFALLMIIERLIYFTRKSTNAGAFTRRFHELVDQRRWQEAREFCARSGSSLARTLGAIAANADKTREAAEKSVREAMLREIPSLEKRLPLIAALGTAAPLLGLLGTVSGLVTLFKVLNQIGANDPKVLAGGISEALVNTETGLAIAIPVLLIHGFLTEKLDTLNATLSSRSLEVLNKLWPKG
jgi:biopolymer transport protein ExbB